VVVIRLRRLRRAGRVWTGLTRLVRDARPLDRLDTIKVKLAVLVGTSVTATAVVFWFGLLHFRWLPRYALPAAVMVALVITQLLAHGMTSPLRDMTAAAMAMARGDYSRRVRATSRDEVGQLARAFNRMAADLEEADRARRELVANVSHELRTPISALQAVLENAVDGVARADLASLRTALDQTERLGRLVSQLLDLSRLDSGVVPLLVAEFPLQPFLAAAVREAAVAHGDAGAAARFVVDVAPADLRAVADPERLAQVVANLLDNACRHSPPSGRVTLTARPGESPGGMWLEVADEGPGIPPAERDRVFERFSRGGGASAADGGTGLGLAIARWAVDLHYGRIAVADSPVGCRIQVALPGAVPTRKPTRKRRETLMTHDASLETVKPPPKPVTGLPQPTDVWPEPQRTAPPEILAGAAVTGLLGAFFVLGEQAGVGILLVGLAATAATWPAARPGMDRWTVVFGGLALALLATVAIRSTPLVALCLLTAFGLASLALASGRRWVSVLLGAVTLPLAGLRMPPWTIRSLTSLGRSGGADRAWPVLRALGIGAALIVLFGALFASADAAFRDLADRALPDVALAEIPQRVVMFGLTAGLVLAAAYLALSPPRWDELPLGRPRPLKRFEWAFPIAVLDALFAAFVLVQITVLFGGDDQILHGAGLTYAEYARAGFFQLVVATALTLGVAAAAAGMAPRTMRSDRVLVRVLLGVLCGLTLVIVASALRRLALYEDAYGLTVARLFAALVELWLAALIGMVMAAGMRPRVGWLLRAAVVSGAAALLGFMAINPEGVVADRNVDRFERTGKVDTSYLDSLSADAAPALDRLPEPWRSCSLSSVAVTVSQDLPWYSDNLALVRARRLIEDRPVSKDARCYPPAP
jgi:two-component system, OmpR family, sensor histidine kinase BaeS